ncbi:D-alanine aminotransferase [Siminovitchia terrae]|uniref:D-alanine aminotransferase n=1 Tax=Siminovitchia terrae TaxID=1914933 RepID=A0A429X192_SIMTE|nr:D-amino-acid transaminase [Siminovitchia terrae]RST57254.1 D-amino-acid transaminase [Siminovitchia terrae]GIN93060.1 D-alanine aminotransferase [Siminovitchia terrae]GIN98793.1 D-alanine aminotransferase [Siminovitchia terrae]
MGKIILGDQILERSDVNIDLEDRGYQFGDGVYEVIRVYGGELFTIKEHIERLFQSAKKIKLDVSMSSEQIRGLTEELVKENGVDFGSVYMQVTRGAAPRAHMFPKPESSTKAVFTAYTNEVPRPASLLEKGVEAITTEDIRWLRCDIKSLNLLPNVLAKQEAADSDCFEAILHRNGIVTEGSSSNAYIVKNGEVITHPANNLILNGITRQVLAELCKENGIPFIEKEFELIDLQNADEVFITSTVSEVMPVIKVNGETVANGKPGNITCKLQGLFEARINQDTKVEI